jgi:hypothetical protein
MPDISILLPTANRPAFLSHALASIARQTALHRVAEVVVMENGCNRESEEVCKRFPQLPIRYEYNDPQITLNLAAHWFGQARHPVVAMLHDDDWWMDFHLERALSFLQQRPEAPAFYCAVYTVSGENVPINGQHGNFISWFANDTTPPGGLRALEFKEVLVASLLATGYHMSSLVCRRPILELCLPALRDGNTYDVDRTLAVEFSRQATLLFHDLPSVFTRMHPGQDGTAAGASGSAQIWFPRNSERLILLARKSGIDVRHEFAERVSRLELNLEKLVPHCHGGALDVLFDQAVMPASMSEDFTRVYRSGPATPKEKTRTRRSSLFGFLRKKKSKFHPES